MEDKGAGNVFAVSREIWDDPDFPAEPFSEREAWIWLIGSCAWKERKVRGSSGSITLKRAEFSFSVRFLAEKFSWSKSRIDRFLSKLKKRDMIRDTSRDGEQIYFIKNYNRFQFVKDKKRDSERDTERDTSGTAAGQQRDKEEEGNKLNKENNVFLTGAEAPSVVEFKPPERANQIHDGNPPWWPKRDKNRNIQKNVDSQLLYDFGKDVLGKSAGGVITDLLKFYDYDYRSVADILLQAHQQPNPMGWIKGNVLKRLPHERVLAHHVKYDENEYRNAL